MGKPISSARWEIGAVADVLDYHAGAANKLMGETIPVSKPGFVFTLREPIGVVGLIVPWNFPPLLASWNVGPALAAGATALLKPAPYPPVGTEGAPVLRGPENLLGGRLEEIVLRGVANCRHRLRLGANLVLQPFRRHHHKVGIPDQRGFALQHAGRIVVEPAMVIHAVIDDPAIRQH